MDTSGSKKSIVIFVAVIALPLLYLLFLYFIPIYKILSYAFVSKSNNFDFLTLVTVFKNVVLNDYHQQIIKYTFYQSFLSSTFTLLIAFPIAYFFAFYDFRFKKLFEAIAVAPFVLPTVIAGAAFDATFGERGLLYSFGVNLDIRYSTTIIVLCHVFYNLGISIKILKNFIELLPNDIYECGKVLGAGKVALFFKVTLPLLAPRIASTFLLVFLLCFSSYGVIMILGGSFLSTIEVEIYRSAIHMLNFKTATVLSMMQIGFSFGILLMHNAFYSRSVEFGYDGSPHRLTKKIVKCLSIEQIVELIIKMIILLIVVLPLLAVFYKAFVSSTSGFTVAYFNELFFSNSMQTKSYFYVPSHKAIINSIYISLCSAFFTFVVGTYFCYVFLHYFKNKKNILESLFLLPLSTSAVTIGLGMLLALNSFPEFIRTSFLLIPAAHSLIALPFFIRNFLPSLQSIDSSIRESAQVLGMPKWKTFFEIDLKILQTPLAISIFLSMIISLGEFGATQFIMRPQAPTMTVAIYRYLSNPGEMNYGCGMAMSAILLTLTLIIVLLIELVPKFLSSAHDYKGEQK